MAIDPSLSLKVQVPHFDDPLANYAKIAQVRNLLTQGQLHQQQIVNEQEQLKTHQLANAEMERNQKDDADFQQAWRETGGDLPKAIELSRQRGVRSGYINKQQDEFNKQAKSLAEADKEKTDLAAKHLDLLYDTLSPVAQLGSDPTQQANLWDSKQQNLVDLGVLKPGQKTPYGGPTAVNDEIARITSHKQLIAAAEEQRKQAGEQRAADLAGPKLKEAESQAITAGQKASGTEPMQPKDIATLNREKARDLAISQNEAVMRTQGQQRVNLEGQRNTREQQIYEQTYGAGSNEALRGVDPKLRVPATKEAQKAADDYNKAATAATDMQTFLDLARSGNKAAGSNLPLVGVSSINALNGIKRINQAEIAQYQGAGSLLDRIQGKIGKLAVGQPIPADVLNDIEALHKTLAGNAVDTYNKRLDGINQNYKSAFKPVAGATKAPKMIRARDKQGDLHEAAEGTPLPDGWKLEGQ